MEVLVARGAAAYRKWVDPMSIRTLSVDQRKSIFLALANAQDTGGMTVPESKKQVAEQFEISRETLDSIEREGVEKDWPPLDDAA